MNSKMTDISSPLPTKSSRYFHIVCIKNKNNATKEVPMKGPVKDLINSQCNFLSMFELEFKNR